MENDEWIQMDIGLIKVVYWIWTIGSGLQMGFDFWFGMSNRYARPKMGLL